MSFDPGKKGQQLYGEYEMNRYIDWFRSFAEGFMQGGPEDHKNIAIKIDHSLRVLDNARKITGSIGLDHSLTLPSHLAALLHDVGRFPQYARFRTFNDRISANHARLSLDVLRSTDVLSDLSSGDRRLVLGAIFLHNRKNIPSGLDLNLDLLARIIRDADKLDIFQVLLSHFEPGAPENGVVTLNLKPHPTAYTEKLLRDVHSGKMARYDEMVWINDLKLLLCGWVYDLGFEVSRKIVVEYGYIERLFDLLPKGPEFAALREKLGRELAGSSGIYPDGRQPAVSGL